MAPPISGQALEKSRSQVLFSGYQQLMSPYNINTVLTRSPMRKKDTRYFFLYFICLFHLKSYLQIHTHTYSLTDTYTHNTRWTSLQIKRILSFTVVTTHYYIRVALVSSTAMYSLHFLRWMGSLLRDLATIISSW